MKRWGAVALIFVLLGIGFAAVPRILGFRRWLIADKTKYGHMAYLGHAVMKFNGRHDRLPYNLEEMVRDGVLPEESEWCFSPIQHRTLGDGKVHFKNCEFEVAFSTSEVVISVPENVLANSKFASYPRSATRFVVTPGMTALPESGSPSKAQ